MGKQLKKYNEQTKQWELISGEQPDVNIIKVLSGETEISDENIIVTNYNYAEDENTTLNETLSVISDDISKLQRNVSWLAEHGGGGGGGGGGVTPTGYGIIIHDPDIQDGAVFTKEESLTVRFAITGGTSEDTFQYRYVFDGTYTSPWSSTTSDVMNTIKVDNIHMVSDNSTHTFKLEATFVALGTSVVPVSFRIYEDVLTIKIDTESNTIRNNEIIVSRLSSIGRVYFKVKNGIVDANTTVFIEKDGHTASANPYKSNGRENTVSVNVWDIIDRPSVKTGDYYELTAYVQSIVGSTAPTISDSITVAIRITSPDEMLIYFDGLSYKTDVDEGLKEPSEFESDGLIRFSFNVNVPNGVTNANIYYAISIIDTSSVETEIIGSMNDSDYASNLHGIAGQNISIQYPLSDYPIANDPYYLRVKAWTHDAGVSAETFGAFVIVESNTEIFPRQFKKREIQSEHPDTMLLSFNKGSRYDYTANEWISSIANYHPLIDIDGTDYTSMHAKTKLQNINGVDSGYKTPSNGSPYVRLQNEAYAVADVTDFMTEITAMQNSVNNLDKDGFTISVTFKADVNANKEKTVFFWGTNNSEGTLINGIKINIEDVEWNIHGTTNEQIKTYVRQGIKNTVDFCYKNGIAYVFVNGVLNGAKKINYFDISSGLYKFGNKIYFGADLISNNFTKFADVDIYEFSVYTAMLSPVQLAVNGKNARLDGNTTDQAVIDDYNAWRKSNLIYTDTDVTIARSYLVNEDGEYLETVPIDTLKSITPIPVITIDANEGNRFTKEVFHKSYDDKSITGTQFECKISYYDPSVDKTVEFRAKIAIQGTSTLAYYVKNLEIIVDEDTSDQIPGKKKLFQPKATWFPEREFTLKADIVDSSHANNATIGKWINDSGIMTNNDAMNAFEMENPNDPVHHSYRPKDICNGVTYTHIDSRDNKKEIDYDENVRMRHNLEGFPVILFIRFAQATNFELIGIYSFNMGRFSYYNMGLSFLKSFSRRIPGAPDTEIGCPALIDYYEEYQRNEQFGNIMPNQIFSYEFGQDADQNNIAYPTWSQADKTILKLYGSFVFNGENPTQDVSEAIWDKLSGLFEVTAKMSSVGLASRGFEPKKIYRYDSSRPEGQQYVEIGQYPGDSDSMSTFNEQNMNVDNAVSYFIVANAFGMVDSLGKNLTLRTWDGGNRWWTCFYDMDTALGLDNLGGETKPETVLIDRYEKGAEQSTVVGILIDEGEAQAISEDHKTITLLNGDEIRADAQDGQGNYIYMYHKYTINGVEYYSNGTEWSEFTTGSVIYHDPESGYGNFRSKLWAILRDDAFMYENGVPQGGTPLYNAKWTVVRQTPTMLPSYTTFTDLMASQIGVCGELLYDYDYHSKYVLDTQNLYMLHGLRIEYVRNWLKNRLYFLDGVFEDKNAQAVFMDSPFYMENTTVSNLGHQVAGQIGYIPYTVRTTANMFLKINTGNGENVRKYFIPSYEDTQIRTPEHTSEKQTIFGSSTLISKLDGLNGIDVITASNNLSSNGKNFCNLVKFDISGTKFLAENPINAQLLFKNGPSGTGESALEEFNVSNTKMRNAGDAFILDFTGFNKLKKINISDSEVTTITFPSSVLSELLVANSRIVSFRLSNQPSLSRIDLTGCTRLQEVELNNCASVTGLTLDSLKDLHFVSVQNCASIESVNISNCEEISRLTIGNNANLREIRLTSSANGLRTVDINISSCPNLETLVISNVNDENIIKIDRASAASIKNLNLTNFYYFAGFKYGNEEIAEYNGDFVLDLSPMTSLETATFASMFSLKYVRFPNIEANGPFRVSSGMFERCTQLTRVFGYIEIADGWVFMDKTNFYINDIGIKNTSYMYGEWHDKENIEFFEGDDVTNVLITSQSLEAEFSRTSCNIGDVYYIMGLIDGNVKNISRMFEFCDNIYATKETPFDENMCKYCTGVTSVNYLFRACPNLDGYVLPPIMSALTKSVTEFRFVFPDGMFYDVNAPLFSDGNQIKMIDGFNPIFADSSFDDDEKFRTRGIDAPYVLNGLNEIEEIANSFNKVTKDDEEFPVQIGFSSWDESGNHSGGQRDSQEIADSNNYPACRLLRGKTKLKKINNSFNGVTTKLFYEGVKYLLCDPSEPNMYPSGLTSVANSFRIDSDNYNSVFFVGNSMFSNCKTTLSSIAGSFVGSMPKVIDINDCTTDINGNKFPYEIFSGMTAIDSVDEFFEHMFVSPVSYYDVSDEPEDDFKRLTFNTLQTITLPTYTDANGVEKSMFRTNTKLKNARSLFKNMYAGNYELRGFGFRNCVLENISEIFSEYESDRDKSDFHNYFLCQKVGMIPYGLFYMDNGNGVIKTTIKTMNGVFEGTSGTELLPYTIDTSSNNASDYMYDGEWNIYLHDGTSAMYDKVLAFKTANPSLPDIPTVLSENTAVTPRINLKPAFIGYAYGNVQYVNDCITKVFVPRNYFCPPDIFRYCNDADTTEANDVFKTYSSSIADGNTQQFKVYGYYGRIPSFIFKPLTNLRVLRGVFYGMKHIIPEIWGTEVINGNDVTYVNGTMYPKIFQYFTNLADISSVFENGRVYGYETVSDLFEGNYREETEQIVDMWRNAEWYYGSEITQSLFAGFTQLMSVVGIFSGNGPRRMYGTLFDASKNTIIDCSNFMSRNATTCEGSLITFWEGFPNIRYVNGCYYGINSVWDSIYTIPNQYKTN